LRKPASDYEAKRFFDAQLPPQRLVLVVDEETDKVLLQAVFGSGLGEVSKVQDAEQAFSVLIGAAA